MNETSNFTLYTSPLSANGRKVLAVSNQLGLKPIIKEINVYKGEGQTAEYLSINPFGKIPSLVENDFILWESNAIIQYISEAHGDYRLSSKDPKKRADIVRWMFWESSNWQPAISNVLSSFVGHALVPEYVPAPTSKPDWKEKSFDTCIQFLNSYLENNQYLVNNELSIADFSAAGMMTYFRFAEFPFEMYKNINRWYLAIESLDSWEKTSIKPWK